MPRFERFNERRPKRDSSDRGSFGDRPRGRRDSGGEFSHYAKKRDLEMTEVICASCGAKCEVPFKPTSSKPVYCRDCFAKNRSSPQSSFTKPSDRELDLINEKLNKIMKALKIE